MPVTAKFSERFYNTLGHGNVDELVDWCNQVDATYRSEFRELFELNFGRFNDRLERGLAEVRAEMNGRFAAADARLEQRIAELEVRLIRWMFVFWIGTIGTVIALTKL